VSVPDEAAVRRLRNGEDKPSYDGTGTAGVWTDRGGHERQASAPVILSNHRADLQPLVFCEVPMAALVARKAISGIGKLRETDFAKNCGGLRPPIPIY